MTGDVVARAKDVLAYGLPISPDLAWALVHEVQRLRAETEGGRTAMTTDPALVERVWRVLLDRTRQQADQDDARAVLDAITETHAVIELPEMRNGSWPVLIGEPEDVYIQSTRREPIRVSGLASFTPDEARILAAALLAAARYAEGKADD